MALYHSEAFIFMSVKDSVLGKLLDPSEAHFRANFLVRQYYFDSEYWMFQIYRRRQNCFSRFVGSDQSIKRIIGISLSIEERD
jgi:hypothetical protein